LVTALLDGLGYDTALLIVPETYHVAVGVSIDANGRYFQYDDKKYYYLETAGNDLKIGQMPGHWGTPTVNVYPLNP